MAISVLCRRSVCVVGSLWCFASVVCGSSLESAAQVFGEAREIASQDNGSLWEVSVAGPVLLVDLQAGIVIASQRDSRGELVAESVDDSTVYQGTLPDDLPPPANTAINWRGERWTMMMLPMPEQKYSRRRLIAHELWHRVQDRLGLPATDATNAHLDALDGRIWMRLEMRALAEMLIREDEHRAQALGDALVFRQMRRSFYPNAASEEDSLELNEGLAEYTGWKLCGLSEQAIRQRAAIALEQKELSGSFARSFAYATGPAYALALDDFRPEWKSLVAAQGTLSGLIPEIVEGLSASSGTLEERAMQAAERYEGDRVTSLERARHESAQRKADRYRLIFGEDRCVVLPVMNSFSYSFNPNAVENVAQLGQVLETASVQDDWGQLDVSSGGVLLVRNESGAITCIKIPGPIEQTEAGYQGEGWKLLLEEGFTLTTTLGAGGIVQRKE